MNIFDIRKDKRAIEGIRFSDDAFIDTTGGGQCFTITTNENDEIIDIPYQDLSNLIKALQHVQGIRRTPEIR